MRSDEMADIQGLRREVKCISVRSQHADLVDPARDALHSAP